MNCIDCDEHEVLPDPDPDDWFCDDDVKVICKAHNNKIITQACRPHHIRNECNTPDWCPMRCPKCKNAELEPVQGVHKEKCPCCGYVREDTKLDVWM